MLQGCAGGLMLLTAALLFLASRKAPPPPPPQTALLNFISSLFGALSTDARHKAQISNFCFRLQRCQLEAPDFTSPAQKYPQPHSAGPAGDT